MSLPLTDLPTFSPLDGQQLDITDAWIFDDVSGGKVYPTVALGNQSSEDEMDLVLSFLSRIYVLNSQPPLGKSPRYESWPMLLLTRSPTYYYTALSMSSYYDFLDLADENQRQDVTLRNYTEFRQRAIEMYSSITDDGLTGGLRTERFFCSVQLSLLEVSHQIWHMVCSKL